MGVKVFDSPLDHPHSHHPPLNPLDNAAVRMEEESEPLPPSSAPEALPPKVDGFAIPRLDALSRTNGRGPLHVQTHALSLDNVDQPSPSTISDEAPANATNQAANPQKLDLPPVPHVISLKQTAMPTTDDDQLRVPDAARLSTAVSHHFARPISPPSPSSSSVGTTAAAAAASLPPPVPPAGTITVLSHGVIPPAEDPLSPAAISLNAPLPSTSKTRNVNMAARKEEVDKRHKISDQIDSIRRGGGSLRFYISEMANCNTYQVSLLLRRLVKRYGSVVSRFPEEVASTVLGEEALQPGTQSAQPSWTMATALMPLSAPASIRRRGVARTAPHGTVTAPLPSSGLIGVRPPPPRRQPPGANTFDPDETDVDETEMEHRARIELTLPDTVPLFEFERLRVMERAARSDDKLDVDIRAAERDLARAEQALRKLEEEGGPEFEAPVNPEESCARIRPLSRSFRRALARNPKAKKERWKEADTNVAQVATVQRYAAVDPRVLGTVAMMDDIPIERRLEVLLHRAAIAPEWLIRKRRRISPWQNTPEQEEERRRNGEKRREREEKRQVARSQRNRPSTSTAADPTNGTGKASSDDSYYEDTDESELEDVAPTSDARSKKKPNGRVKKGSDGEYDDDDEPTTKRAKKQATTTSTDEHHSKRARFATPSTVAAATAAAPARKSLSTSSAAGGGGGVLKLNTNNSASKQSSSSSKKRASYLASVASSTAVPIGHSKRGRPPGKRNSISHHSSSGHHQQQQHHHHHHHQSQGTSTNTASSSSSHDAHASSRQLRPGQRVLSDGSIVELGCMARYAVSNALDARRTPSVAHEPVYFQPYMQNTQLLDYAEIPLPEWKKTPGEEAPQTSEAAAAANINMDEALARLDLIKSAAHVEQEHLEKPRHQYYVGKHKNKVLAEREAEAKRQLEADRAAAERKILDAPGGRRAASPAIPDYQRLSRVPAFEPRNFDLLPEEGDGGGAAENAKL